MTPSWPTIRNTLIVILYVGVFTLLAACVGDFVKVKRLSDTGAVETVSLNDARAQAKADMFRFQQNAAFIEDGEVMEAQIQTLLGSILQSDGVAGLAAGTALASIPALLIGWFGMRRPGDVPASVVGEEKIASFNGALSKVASGELIVPKTPTPIVTP